MTSFIFFQSFVSKAFPCKFNKSTYMFFCISLYPYFISIELKLRISSLVSLITKQSRSKSFKLSSKSITLFLKLLIFKQAKSGLCKNLDLSFQSIFRSAAEDFETEMPSSVFLIPSSKPISPDDVCVLKNIYLSKIKIIC